MPSGKQSKRRRRAAAAPPPPVGRRRDASTRVLLGAVAAVALISVALVAGFAFGGRGVAETTAPARGSLVNALPGAEEVERLLKGIPQHGNALGSPSAPVRLVEYVDVQCPYCQRFEVDVIPELVRRYVRPGRLAIELRPIAFVGTDSRRGRAAAIAAGRQARLFYFVQLLYLHQGPENTGWVDDDLLRAAAASIPGVDVTRLLEDAGSAAVEGEGARFDRQANAEAVRSTPTVLVGRSGARARPVVLASPEDVASVAAAIERALRES
jgi:protein-disulfide isomerase